MRRGRSDTPVGGYRRERDRDSKVTRMALYYFEIYRDGNEAEIDRHGTDLPDLASVRSHVLGLLPRIVGGLCCKGTSTTSCASSGTLTARSGTRHWCQSVARRLEAARQGHSARQQRAGLFRCLSAVEELRDCLTRRQSARVVVWKLRYGPTRLAPDKRTTVGAVRAT